MRLLLAFLFGALVAYAVTLRLVGYGVRGGTEQIGKLWRYRRGNCRCALCRSVE